MTMITTGATLETEHSIERVIRHRQGWSAHCRCCKVIGPVADQLALHRAHQDHVIGEHHADPFGLDMMVAS